MNTQRTPPSIRPADRRGTVAIVVVLVLVLLQLATVAMVVSGSRHQDMSGTRINSIRSFYAAEAGINMGVRELMNNQDEDGDGTIGAVSDNGKFVDDPSPGQGATFVVSKTIDGSLVYLRAVATANSTVRFVEISLEFQ